MPYPKVGVALGSGAARGLANLGVLQVLQEEQIPIQIITGTSAGAIIGGLYAAGVDLSMIERLSTVLDWNDLTNWTLNRKGLVSADKIHGMLRMLTKDQHFEDLPIQAAVVATDLLSGQEVVFDSGSVADGIRASLSIPGVFVPFEQDGKVLVDGALVNRVPADVCRRLGADVVIAVDVGLAPLRNRIRNLPDVIVQTIDILTRQIAQYDIPDANVLIEPDLGNVTLTQLNRASEIIEKGRQATKDKLEEIKNWISLGNVSATDS